MLDGKRRSAETNGPLYRQQDGAQSPSLLFQASLDRAASYRQTEAFKKAVRKLQVWVEPLVGKANSGTASCMGGQDRTCAETIDIVACVLQGEMTDGAEGKAGN